MLRVPPVGFLLADHASPDFRRVSQPQLKSQLRQQPLEPGIMPASLHPYPHALSPQSTIKLLRLFAVTQPFFLILPSLVIKDRDLLKTRMKITAYNQHDIGSFSVSLGRFAATNLLAAIEPTSLCNQAPRVRFDMRSRNAVEGPRASYRKMDPMRNSIHRGRNSWQGRCHRRQTRGPS